MPHHIAAAMFRNADASLELLEIITADIKARRAMATRADTNAEHVDALRHAHSQLLAIATFLGVHGEPSDTAPADDDEEVGDHCIDPDTGAVCRDSFGNPARFVR